MHEAPVEAVTAAPEAFADPMTLHASPPLCPLIPPSKLILISRDLFELQSTGKTVAHVFHIATLDQPENQTAVSIAGFQPTCRCLDFRRRPGFIREHILFVYVHVVNHPSAAALYEEMRGMSNAWRLVPPIPKKREVSCVICFCVLSAGPDRSSADPAEPEGRASIECAPMHTQGVEAWRRGIAKYLPLGFDLPKTPADLDVSHRKVVQVEDRVLVGIPIKIVEG